MRPAYDLCDLCRLLSKACANKINVDEVQKTAAANEYLEHLEKAANQRKYYNKWRQEAQQYEESECLVLSMDFAQNDNFPSGKQQVGTAYFKSARKCAVFGICNEKRNI